MLEAERPGQQLMPGASDSHDNFGRGGRVLAARVRQRSLLPGYDNRNFLPA